MLAQKLSEKAMIADSTRATTPICLICNAPLPVNRVRKDRLCGRMECGWEYAQLQRQRKLCKVCGCPLTARELATRICGALECQRTALADFSRRLAERNRIRSRALIEREAEQATQLRDRVMSQFGFSKPEDFPLVVIPAFTAELVSLPTQRRRTFREHLMALIEQSAPPPEPPVPKQGKAAPVVPDPTPEAQAVSGMACSCCKGRCCEGGGDHAYLKVETIRRYRAEHPDQRPRDVLAAYLGRVGRRSYQGSCIFHQRDGCALSRDMRADLCNQHYCKALLGFRQTLPQTGAIGAFFVAADYGELQAAALVRGNRLLAIGPTLPRPLDPTDE